MSTYSSGGEVFGAKVFNAAIIAVSVVVLLGALTAPSAQQHQTAQASAPVQEVVVVKAPSSQGHV